VTVPQRFFARLDADRLIDALAWHFSRSGYRAA